MNRPCLAQLPGFARGLTFQDDKALVTISKLRSPQSNGLAIAEQLKNSNHPDGVCGIRVVDLNTGEIQGSLNLPESVDEVFDIALLTGIQRASVLANDADDAERLIKLPNRVELLSTRPKPPQSTASTPAGSNLRYQRIFHLTADNLAPYAELTFPSLAPGGNAQRKLNGPLVAVCALAGEQMVGLAIAECKQTGSAQVVSLKVQPDWRGRGVGSLLMKSLMRCLHLEGMRDIHIRYQSTTESEGAIESLLLRLGWSKPHDTFLLLEGLAERLATIPWADNYPITQPYRLATWQPQYTGDASKLNAPSTLLASTTSPNLDPNISLALLHNEQLVGWVLVDRTTPTQVRYSSLFVAPEHRGRARGLALLASAFRRQGELGPPVARAGVAPESGSMIRLAQRHLRPYLQSISRARQSEILLPKSAKIQARAPAL
ncbi:GNAT family N-acetyltransferase [Vulcanococcus sp. Clear-D1]|uniref:GNAT family N-acetyltransferase n=1 Tax=Vulcanococcus sp. Clear-D1 TaxID=2766970 RepID=UPI0019CCCFD2|nr:GNAT family N-acetyltransferase [Vulcanococcus sp. Clear-D1]MBD1193313.1 GNAT family N-acetyltransferase [Vulcanococcus sp. Clear-D1]